MNISGNVTADPLRATVLRTPRRRPATTSTTISTPESWPLSETTANIKHVFV